MLLVLINPGPRAEIGPNAWWGRTPSDRSMVRIARLAPGRLCSPLEKVGMGQKVRMVAIARLRFRSAAVRGGPSGSAAPGRFGPKGAARTRAAVSAARKPGENRGVVADLVAVSAAMWPLATLASWPR